MSDETNPRFTFSTTRNEILMDAVQGKVNLLQLAALELANRGFDHKGEFVGFAKSQEIFDEFMQRTTK